LWIGRDLSQPIIIDSGRGCQAWIRLEDIEMTNDIRRRNARRVNGYWLGKLDESLGLTHGCRIDTSVSDLPRVMRCPGTVNVKTGRVSCFINAPTNIYEGLAVALTLATPKQALKDPEPPQGIVPGSSWQDVFTHLTKMAQGYLLFGHEEPGRHKVMWHTAKKLQELGVSRQEARRAIRWANQLKGKEAALPRDQVEHALGTAYGA
jgi:hypothetical protein